MKRRGSGLALGTILALGVGYVAGILTAPKSGRETRRRLAEVTAQQMADSEKKFKTLYADLAKSVEKAEAKVAKMRSKTKTELSGSIKQARAAMKVCGEMLSAIREGEADNKDLQKALKDSKKAYSHLKKYLQNETKKAAKKA